MINRAVVVHLAAVLALAASGCSTQYSHLNRPLSETVAPDCRASLQIAQPRGEPDVLVILCLSGGGSRAAWFSAAAMLRLERVVDERNLLHEVDVISSVSGGSLPAAYYCVTRDPGPYSVVHINSTPSRLPDSLPKVVKLDRSRGLLGVRGAMTVEQHDLLRAQFGSSHDQTSIDRLYWLSTHTRAPAVWQPKEVRALMTRDYIKPLVTRSFAPWYLGEDLTYWTTAYDRSDQMADIFKRNLYGTKLVDVPKVLHAAELELFGNLHRPVESDTNQVDDLEELRWPKQEREGARPWLIAGNVFEQVERATRNFRHYLPYRFKDLNPERPYLILNATNGSEDDPDESHTGEVFTFTRDDFQRYLNSGIDDYPVAWGVMASAAFPGAFSFVTLRDFRPAPDARPRYMHVFDGGNTDNLGLTSAKRIILANRDRYRHFVVILVDSHVPSFGASRLKADVRTKVVDINFMTTFGSLIDQVRRQSVEEFNSGHLGGEELRDKLTFWHIAFDHLKDADLRNQANHIPTSFKISRADAVLVERCVDELVRADDPKLQEILRVLRGPAQPAATPTAAKTE